MLVLAGATHWGVKIAPSKAAENVRQFWDMFCTSKRFQQKGVQIFAQTKPEGAQNPRTLPDIHFLGCITVVMRRCAHSPQCLMLRVKQL